MSSAAVTTQDLDRAVGSLHGTMQAITQDLDRAVGELRGEMHAIRDELRGEIHELRGEMHAIRGELRGEMHAMKTDLIREIGVATSHVANVMMEHIQSLVSVVEDKYRHLPSEHAKLRDDFNAHSADFRLHAPLPPSAPRRARRPRS